MPAAGSSLFLAADAIEQLDRADAAALDGLDVGVIGFDQTGLVQRYNACESRFSALRPAEVLGRPLFTEVAQCMNNYLVCQRFDDALAADIPLDARLDYVLTWRMRPTAVQLRLLWRPGAALRYLLLRHGQALAGPRAAHR
jgi:photoactive yellow protein